MNDEYTIGGKWLEDLNNDLEGSDRSCAVLAGAVVDDYLKTPLMKYLISPDNNNDKLLGRFAPIDSFAARIELARRLNLISADMRKALDWVRDIRNKAAHRTNFEFDNNSNKDIVTNIITLLDLENKVPDIFIKPYDGTKGNFVGAVVMLIACLNIETCEIKQTTFSPINAIGNIRVNNG